MIRLVTVIGHGTNLLPHFINHYKKYVDEIKNFKEKKITYKKAKETDVKVISSDWTHEEEQKLINFYKKNVPEIVLSKIFKRSMNEIREKILKLLKLN